MLIHVYIIIAGMEHKLQFFPCGCEPLAVTMTRAKLWPASSTNPRFAFTFALLDWAEACLLEAHVSLQDFCNTLKFRCPFHNLRYDHYSFINYILIS